MSDYWTVYLSGEIHTDWREQIIDGCAAHDLPVEFVSPITNHSASDAAGDMLGKPDSDFWRDHQSSRVNSIRTRTLIERADIAVVRFGSEYKQWNAAFDAGFCAAMSKPYITLHDQNIVHPLKEVNAAAMGSARTPDQVVELLRYVVGSPDAPHPV